MIITSLNPNFEVITAPNPERRKIKTDPDPQHWLWDWVIFLKCTLWSQAIKLKKKRGSYLVAQCLQWHYCWRRCRNIRPPEPKQLNLTYSDVTYSGYSMCKIGEQTCKENWHKIHLFLGRASQTVVTNYTETMLKQKNLSENYTWKARFQPWILKFVVEYSAIKYLLGRKKVSLEVQVPVIKISRNI